MHVFIRETAVSRCTQRTPFLHLTNIPHTTEMYLRDTRASLEFALLSRDSIIACVFVLLNTNTQSPQPFYRIFYSSIHNGYARLPWRKTAYSLFDYYLRNCLR